MGTGNVKGMGVKWIGGRGEEKYSNNMDVNDIRRRGK